MKSILPEYDEIGDYNKVVETIDLWYKEIFNYYDYQYTNAITEHINGDINKIALNGKGYSFETLRYKALYDQSVKKYTVFQYMDEPEEPDKIPRKRRKLN